KPDRSPKRTHPAGQGQTQAKTALPDSIATDWKERGYAVRSTHRNGYHRTIGTAVSPDEVRLLPHAYG
ncbi:MAG TPA: hypothetical protein VKY38_03335, partial [Azoarcus sp.]|nr:hypothetical protein [Azoarcus sp.]